MRYNPTRYKNWKGTPAVILHDQAKLNLLWLVYPEIDNYTTTPWPGRPGAESIFREMTTDVRAILEKPPVEFMQDFVAMGPHDMALTERFPTNYLQTMWRRAKEANARLVKELGDNVYHFNFRARR